MLWEDDARRVSRRPGRVQLALSRDAAPALYKRAVTSVFWYHRHYSPRSACNTQAVSRCPAGVTGLQYLQTVQVGHRPKYQAHPGPKSHAS